MIRFLVPAGLALMVVWSEAAPLTACYLAVRWWFSPSTPVSSTIYNWLVTNQPQYGTNVTKNEIPISSSSND